MRLAILAFGGVLSYAATAHAQIATEAGVVEGAGVKVGEGTVLHPVLGVESGIVYNVFYEDTTPRTSGLLRVLGEMATGSLPGERMQLPQDAAPETQDYGALAYRLDLDAQYEEYLSTVEAVQAQRDFRFGVAFRGIAMPMRTWQLHFSDALRRETRPVNFESPENVDRDINSFGLALRFRPKGRTLSGQAEYSNVIDYFEDTNQQFANRVAHNFGVGAAWQFLPVSRLFADTSIGYVGPLGSVSTKVSSLPFRVKAGIATALTVKTGVSAHFGFAKGFYSSGPDFTGVFGRVQLSHRFTHQSVVAAAYDYDFHDSINANFYRDHAVKLMVENRLDRFVLDAGTDLRFRLYRGVIDQAMGTTPDRSDIIFSITGAAAYRFRDWIAATLEYAFVTDGTDFRYQPSSMSPTLDDPSYTRQTLMLGVRAAY